MNLAQMEIRVLEIVQDESFSGNIRAFINQGIREVGKFKLSTLDTSDTVDCTAILGSVALPSDYMHGLYHVHDGDTVVGTPAFYEAFSRFLRYHPDLSYEGKIVDVAVRGLLLHYVGREDKTLTLRYFQKPDTLTSKTDTPSFLPEHLHEPILVNYAAAQIFNLIEDGIEDPKTNTRIYQSLYAGGIADLSMFTVSTDEPEYVQDEAQGIW